MTGFVYAIQAGEAVKIGWATEPVRRLSELNVGSPGTHKLLGFVAATKNQERELHLLLSPWRIRGEWFSVSKPVAHFIDMLPRPPERERRQRISLTTSFREIIDAFGVAKLATLLGVAQSHVHTMKVRNVIPPQYWRKILDAPKPNGAVIDPSLLADLYAASREKEGEAAE